MHTSLLVEMQMALGVQGLLAMALVSWMRKVSPDFAVGWLCSLPMP